MFWDVFYNLCTENNIKPNAVCKKLELSTATATHWKKGTIPNGDALLKIADYFQCSVDYLLGREKGINNINNFGNNNVTYGENSDIRVTNGPDTDETSRAISEMLKNLSLKDRSELILMIYKFYEEHQKDKK